MRFRLFLILIGVAVLSLASGLGLKFALAWVEPTLAPPLGNVAPPINEGGIAQTKIGGLTIGGVFTVTGTSSWAIIGTPTAPGGGYSKGTLNAERLCINGDCLSSWAIADAFVQNGNSFGELATLGTNDNFDLAFETNGTEKMRITTAGNVGIGTAAPGAKLHVYSGGTDYAEFRIESAARTPSVHFRQGVNDWYWKVDHTDNKFKITKDVNDFVTIDNTGNVGIGTASPASKLHVYGGDLTVRDANGDTVFIGEGGGGSGRFDFFYQGGASATQNLLFFGGDAGNTYQMDRFDVYATNSYFSGNVGIGTANPSYKLVVAGASPRGYLWPSGGGNPELNFGDQTYTNHWGVYRANGDATNDLRFWYGTVAGVGNNNVTMTAAGDLNSRRCFGPVYVGQTAATYDGLRGGYDDVNSLCNTAVAGSHVCQTSEILETIKCNQASLPTADMAWIANGPPGYTARANDCKGWTSNTGSGAEIAYGAIWAFDASGGVGWVTTCNMSLKFACCK